jgi:hypothetical protein
MRFALSVLMALHGVAHLVGFVGPWRFAAGATMPYKTTIFAGRIDLGDAGIRVIGLVWLFAALAFVVSAVGGITNKPWWIPTSIGVVVASLLLSGVEWPEARIGLFVNVLLLAALALGRRLAWF